VFNAPDEKGLSTCRRFSQVAADNGKSLVFPTASISVLLRSILSGPPDLGGPIKDGVHLIQLPVDLDQGRRESFHLEMMALETRIEMPGDGEWRLLEGFAARNNILASSAQTGSSLPLWMHPCLLPVFVNGWVEIVCMGEG